MPTPSNMEESDAYRRGTLFLRRGNLKRARLIFEKTLTVVRQGNDPVGEAEALRLRLSPDSREGQKDPNG